MMLGVAAVVALLAVGASCDCTMTMVGKRATADGSVLASYSNDYTGNTPVGVIPYESVPASRAAAPSRQCTPESGLPPVPAGGTYRAFAVSTPAIRESSLNSAGLGMNYGVYLYPRSDVAAADPWVSNGLGTEMWDIVMQRCSNPRQAVTAIAAMIRACGASSMIGGGVGIFNRDEAWVIDIISGHHYVAVRVPDDSYLAEPNMLRTKSIDYRSSDFIVSPKFLDFAKSIGAASASATTVDVARGFNDGAVGAGRQHALDRLYLMLSKLSPSAHYEHNAALSETPWFARPDRPLTVADLRAAHRDHGPEAAYAGASPHNMEYSATAPFTPVCRGIQTYHVIWKMPRRGPATMIVGACSACVSAMVPYWVETVPMVWSDDAVTKATTNYVLSLSLDNFRVIQHKMDATDSGGRPEYPQHIASLAARQPALDGLVDQAVAAAERDSDVRAMLDATVAIAGAVRDFSSAAIGELFSR